MTQKEYREYLLHVLKKLNESTGWLQRSYDKCLEHDLSADLSEDQFDDFENLTSRFARTSDILMQKAFRALDEAEFEGGGTMIDTFNRAHKRGLIDSVEFMRDLRELRNEISHDYNVEDLKQLFRDVLEQTPLILQVIERIRKYAEKFNEE
ncbi:MAG: hypothetical protein PHW04_02785 [Candidatus Wallbacteria bacterium]|nr:hypothetical protein [Candidatus Wallbacteria bacterium]